MNANKAAYWIAVAALALGLNSEYREGNFVGLHRVADRAGSVLCRLTTRAEQTLAVAQLKLLTTPEEDLPNTLRASADAYEMAQASAEIVREQSQSREEAELFRDEVRDRMRDEIRAQADVIRAQAKIRRAEIEIQLRTHLPFTLANVTSPGLTVFCPKTGTRVALNHVVAGSKDAEMREAF